MKLSDLLPPSTTLDSDELLDLFLRYPEQRGIELYPAQESAILELYDGKNVILNTPTGSGKSLVATAGHFLTLARGRRTVYTCPIKALVNEKWLSLCREFGPDNVGLSTGDASVNRDAPILCCTAEVLANIALRHGDEADVQDVVMDEFHYYADRDRGVAWQVPLLTMPQARFLLMSATLGDTRFFEQELTRLTGLPSVTIDSRERPVPLAFEYVDTPLPVTLENLLAQDKGPVYIVHFTQLEAAKNAQSLTSLGISSREEKDALAAALRGVEFRSPYGSDVKRWLRHGIGIHHAGLLPKYRMLVEQLAQQGLLKVICGTDTLGVGINVPIRTVLFTRLCKYDGQKTAILSARDFHQISGRAGRKGFDDQGWVVAQAPEHVVENVQLERKRARTGKKITKRKPPDRNFVNWDKKTFERLIAAPPERLNSRFAVTHGMLLNMLSRDTDGCAAMRALIADSHESDKAREAHIKRAWQLFRSLVQRGIVEFIPPTPRGAKLRVNVELQDDFSMNQTLSLYLLETIPLLDREAPEYPLVLLTLVESILEDPQKILRSQLDKLKTEKMAEMKQEGIPFEERIEELEKLEYPKPNREFIYRTFNEFADRHPWVGQENIRPKSIVREMFEEFRSFTDYVRDYGLGRIEGLLLRHINSVYDVLTQTVPDGAKDDIVREMELYLREMIRQVDSSHLDEWEKLRNPAFEPEQADEVRPPGAEEIDITRDRPRFIAAIRTRLFAFLRALQVADFDAALAAVAPRGTETNDDDSAPEALDPDGTPWSSERLRDNLEQYLAEHEDLRLDPEARNIRHTHVDETDAGRRWLVQQVLVDTDEHNDWVAEFVVDIEASREAGEPVLVLRGLASLGEV